MTLHSPPVRARLLCACTSDHRPVRDGGAVTEDMPNAQNTLSCFEASLPDEALVPHLLSTCVVRHRGLEPLTFANRKCRAGKDWIQGGA